VLTLNDTAFPTVERLEQEVDQAINSQKPLVIIVDDLTGMINFLIVIYFII